MKIENISDEFLNEVTLLLKALADPTRLKIIRSLHAGEKSVSEIVSEIGTGQANISKHLKSLQQAKVVTSRRQSQNVYYNITSGAIENLCKTLCETTAQVLHIRFSSLGLKDKASRLLKRGGK